MSLATPESVQKLQAALHELTTSAAEYPNIRSAPTLKIWITPLASVAMLEKFALLKMALWRAPAFSNASSDTPGEVPSEGTEITETGGMF